MFQTKDVEKIKPYLYSIEVFRKSCLLRDNAKNIVQADMPHMTI
jgi:hypothetical protein